MTNQQGAPEALANFDAAVAAVLQCVGTAPCNSHEICTGFAANTRKRLAALLEAQQPAPSAAVAHAEMMRKMGERQAFEVWFKVDCPVEGVNARIAAKAAWQARAALAAPHPSSTPQADSQRAPEYVGNGMFNGETIEKAAEHWANWCDVRCMTGLSEFLRVVASRASADSVLEDAARLDWLALAGPTSICLVIDRPHDGEVEVATDDVTGYGKTLREAIDAAMNKGGA